MIYSQLLIDKKDTHKLSMLNNSLYFSIGYRLEDSDMKNIEFKEASQNIMNKFKKLKDKRKKAEAKLIKANYKMKEFALKYGIENYSK